MKRLVLSIVATLMPIAANAQTVPTIDTEDATLRSQSVDPGGWLHPAIGVDLRNGDFARGNYDDDAANLDRLPVHVQVGAAADLHRARDGKADTWLVVRSSNGFHAPSPDDTGPRAWYESNNLVALVATPAPGLRTAAVFTVKTSPDGVSGTTNEASLSLAYSGKRGLGTLKPTFAATTRTKGTHGLYTQIGIEPSLPLGAGDDAAKLGIPVAIGIGWGGFYRAGSGNRVYGNAGLGLSKPFKVGAARWSARAHILALIRDDRLRRLSGPFGETGTVVPLGTLSLSLTY